MLGWRRALIYVDSQPGVFYSSRLTRQEMADSDPRAALPVPVNWARAAIQRRGRLLTSLQIRLYWIEIGANRENRKCSRPAA